MGPRGAPPYLASITANCQTWSSVRPRSKGLGPELEDKAVACALVTVDRPGLLQTRRTQCATSALFPGVSDDAF